MESITYHRGSSETALKNGSDCAKITKTGTYQRSFLYNRAGMCQVFLKNGSSYSLLSNTKIQLLLHNQNSFAATRSKIQYLQFNTYSIQNSKSNISNTTHSQFKIQVSTKTKILSINTKLYKSQ